MHGLDLGGHKLELARLLRAVQHGLFAFRKHVPRKGRAGVFPLGFGKAHVGRNLALAPGIGVIVGACVAAVKAVVGQVDMEGLDVVYVAAGQQLQGEAGDAAADVAFGHDEGLHIGRGGPEAGPQADVLEQHGVDIVEHQQIQILLFRQTLHAHGGADRGQELALVHIGQHFILGGDALHH